jgi:hypothetical protein
MEINDLKKRRLRLRDKIKLYDLKGKDATKMVYEYHELIEELKKCGINHEIKAPYLQKSYWDNKFKKASQQIQENNSNIIKKEELLIKPTQDSFILCLAWTDIIYETTPSQIKKVMDYFNELCLPLIDEEVNHIDNRTEHILKYEFKGSEESFRLLKLCTQFVLDAFAQTDFEKFNIAIFGKKKNF